MSPQLRSVEEAGIKGLLRKSRPEQISQGDFFEEPERLRGLFAQLVHAPSADSVALIPSVSYGMAVLAQNLPARAGQKIIMAGEQFPSNVYPWTDLARKKALHVVQVPIPAAPDFRSITWNEHILQAIDQDTALVTIAHVHWANGTLFDLKAISERVHKVGGLLVVDGTQSVGALPMDVQTLGIDALVCAGYKWLMGPYGLGYAWFGQAFAEGEPIEQNWINRLTSEDFSRLVAYRDTYQPGARRFDMGERSNFILVPMGIAALEQILAWTPAFVQSYCAELTEPYVEQWRKAGYWIEALSGRAAHLIGVQTPGNINLSELHQKLREEKIYVSVRGNFVRIAPNVYNNPADMEAITRVLRSI
jgi:selenocysteine lyase/cysteine desulfurase